MPAAKPIASAAGLIQAIKGAREPLLVAYTLMDNASMQRLWARSSEALDQDNYTAEKIRERIFCDDDLTECFEWPGVDPVTEAEWRDTARSRVTTFVTLLLEEVRTSVEARVTNATTALKNSVEAQISASELAIISLTAEVNRLSEENRLVIDEIETKRQEAIRDFETAHTVVCDTADQVSKLKEAIQRHEKVSVGHWTMDESEETDRDSEAYEKVRNAQDATKSLQAALKRLEDDRLAYFRLPTQTGEAGGKSDKTLSQLLPNGIKKSSAHQIGIAILTYMKARPSQFYTIIHYVERVVNDFNVRTKEHYMPPSATATDDTPAYTGVPANILDSYKSQSDALYTALKAIISVELMERMEQQNQMGIYISNGKTFIVAEGDGPMAVC